MKKTYFLFTTYLIFVQFTRGQDQMIPQYLDSIAQVVHFDNLSKERYDSIVHCNNFNFLTFKPDSKRYNKANSTLYYREGRLWKLSFENLKFKYDAYFQHYKTDIIYTVFCYWNANKATKKNKGMFVRGLFFHRSRYHDNFFLKINTSTFSSIEKKGWRKRNQLVINKASTSDITTILRLDPYLFPEKRLNCYKGEILSFSDFVYTKLAVYEDIMIPAKQTCKNQLHLDSLTVTELCFLLGSNSCSNGVGIKAVPKSQDPEVPLWFLFDHEYYDGIPSDEKEHRIQRGGDVREIKEYFERDD